MADDNVGHQPLPRHGVERFGDAMADSRMVIGSTHVSGHMRICTRADSARCRTTRTDGIFWSMVSVMRLTSLPACASLSGQGSELTETPSMNKRHMHSV